MTVQAAAPLTLLTWDTDFFGVSIARWPEETFLDSTIEETLRWAKAQRVACIYLLVSADDMARVALAQQAGFRLMDIRVTLTTPVPEALLPPDGVLVRPSQDADLPALKAIAGQSFTQSRFYADPNFPEERCNELYRKWIENSHQGALADHTLVVDVDESLAGFITLTYRDDKQAEIGLLAVGETFRGRSLGLALTQHSLAQARQDSIEVISVVTQGSNISSQRVYQRAGFRTSNTQLWFHLWLLTP